MVLQPNNLIGIKYRALTWYLIRIGITDNEKKLKQLKKLIRKRNSTANFRCLRLNIKV